MFQGRYFGECYNSAKKWTEMHELGVLIEAVKTVNRIAEQNHISKVKHMTLEVGETSGYVPMYIIKESLKKVTYIAGMDTCLCREATDCQDYPKDIACLFLGEAGKIVVKHGLGKEFTYEEACERVDQAAAHGLMGHAVWIEAIFFDEEGKVVINQEICVGCGICKSKCPSDVIKIKQTMPMRKDLHDYFATDYNLDLKIWNED